MMYTVTRMMEDFEMVKAMLKVIDKVENKEAFTLEDIPEDARHHYRLDPHGWYRNEPRNFSGPALSALVKRGLLEVVGKEDYIWEDEYDTDRKGNPKKKVGTRKIYRVADDVTFEDYKSTFAELLYKKIMAL